MSYFKVLVVQIYTLKFITYAVVDQTIMIEYVRCVAIETLDLREIVIFWECLDYKGLDSRNMAQDVYVQWLYNYYIDLGSKC